MVDAVDWPEGVPPCVMPIGATGGFVDNRYSFETESRIQPVQRPRSSWAPERYQVELTQLSRRQFGKFQDWYRVALAYGTRPFLMRHPITGVPGKWKIVKADPPYQVRKEGLMRGPDVRRIGVSMTIQSLPLAGGAGELLVAYGAPSGNTPVLVMDFVEQVYSLNGMTTVPFPLTCNRASTGTVWNTSQRIEMVAVNQPRFDHDPETGEPLGALVEDQSVNLLLDSQNMPDSGSAWGTIGSPGVVGTATPVNSCIVGGTAWRHESGGDPAEYYRRFQTFGVFSGNVETFSVIIENEDATQTTLWLYDVTANNYVERATYDWASGTITSTNGGAVKAETLQAVGPNGGKLVRISVSHTGTPGNIRRVYFLPVGEFITTRACIAHAMQLEERPSATSYIPTKNSAVTRAFDGILLSTDRFPYNTAEGTYAVAHEGIDDPNWRSIYLSATATPSYRDLVVNGGDFRMAAGTTVMAKVVPGFPSGYAMAADASGMSLSVEGAAVEAGSVITQSTGAPVNLFIGGSGFVFGAINGHFKLLRYWPERLPDSDLVELST